MFDAVIGGNNVRNMVEIIAARARPKLPVVPALTAVRALLHEMTRATDLVASLRRAPACACQV